MIDFTQGGARETIAPEDVAVLREAGALIEDARRERPRYFDGRFLAARDLIRDQQYFLAREADLGQTTGGGVATGLRVARGGNADELHIERGHGLTPSGEITLLPRTLSVRLADIPLSEQLSARFGLRKLPQPPQHARSGLYVLALRPVEFTANPIGAYPTSITGQRTVEDGDTIEATAIVLVPWNEDNATDALDARRARAARSIFVEKRPNGVSANVLPLAMIALQNNVIAWVDMAMVRRELGADRADLPTLGIGGRAIRMAHLLQYQQHLVETVAANRNQGFPAASRFPALPPAGPMPRGMINVRDFTQNFFPAEIDVEMAPIPDDELPALIDEALALPAIDFTVPVELLESTSVVVLCPIPRSEWRATLNRLLQQPTDARTRRLLPAAANRLAARKPLEVLQGLRLPRPLTLPVDTSDPREQEWARLAALPNLWFARRRNLAYREDLPGLPVPFSGADDLNTDTAMIARIDDSGLRPRFDGVMDRTNARSAAEVTNLLSSRRIAESPALTAIALGELERAPNLDRASVLAISARLNASDVGSGITRLERTQPDVLSTPQALDRIAANPNWREVDTISRVAPATVTPDIARNVAAGTPIPRDVIDAAQPRVDTRGGGPFTPAQPFTPATPAQPVVRPVNPDVTPTRPTRPTTPTRDSVITRPSAAGTTRRGASGRPAAKAAAKKSSVKAKPPAKKAAKKSAAKKRTK
jgi:hypothetical protein